jgi:hypothetical protein
VGGCLLAEQLQGAGAEALEGADAGCGSHGRRSGDPSAGRGGVKGQSTAKKAERSAANEQAAASRQPLRPPRTMRRAARSRSTKHQWGRNCHELRRCFLFSSPNPCGDSPSSIAVRLCDVVSGTVTDCPDADGSVECEAKRSLRSCTKPATWLGWRARARSLCQQSLVPVATAHGH